MTGVVRHRPTGASIDQYAPSPTPNWANISRATFASGTNADQTISGILAGSTVVRVTVVNALYSVANAIRVLPSSSTIDLLSSTDFTINNAETWHFAFTFNGTDPVVSSLVTIKNLTGGLNTIDTFTVTLD